MLLIMLYAVAHLETSSLTDVPSNLAHYLAYFYYKWSYIVNSDVFQKELWSKSCDTMDH